MEGVQGSTSARVMLADGSVVSARRGVVVAVEGPEAKRLLGPALEVRGWGGNGGEAQWQWRGPRPSGCWVRPSRWEGGAVPKRVSASAFSSLLIPNRSQASPSKAAPGMGTCCLYFSAPQAPSPQPMLYLNGEDNDGVVNNCCFPSTVSGMLRARERLLECGSRTVYTILDGP